MQAHTAPAPARDADLVFEDAPFTLDEVPTDGTGDIPRELNGALYRNGAGIQRVGDRRLHWLDGYGFLAAARFEDGRLTVTGRHVPTPVLAEERAAGRQLRRRAFTNRPERWRNLLDTQIANAAGHDAVAWAGRVWACDNPEWIPLHPRTLEPVPGEAPITAKAPAQLGPMPRPDSWTGRLVGYRVTPGLRADTIEVVEYDDSMRVAAGASHVLPVRASALHDAVATEHHLVVTCFGHLSLGALLWGAGSVFDAIGFDPQRSLPILVVPRGAGGVVRRIDVPAGHHGFHLFNAYEDGGRLTVDAVIYRGRVDFHAFFPPGTGAPTPAPVEGPFPTRFVLDLATGSVDVRRIEGPRGDAPEVDARYHGRPYRYGFAASPVGRGDEPVPEAFPWFHGVARIDMQGTDHATFGFGPRVFTSPPAFVARGEAEGDGWLLVWLLDAAARRTGVAILDATDLARGPIATRWLNALLPGVSHVSWGP